MKYIGPLDDVLKPEIDYTVKTQKMPELEIIKGKFYEDGKLVPTEFGNKRQIWLMEQRLNELRALEDGDLEADVEISTVTKVDVNFKCPCGQRVWFGENEYDDEDEDYRSDFKGAISKCMECNKEYTLYLKGEKRDKKLFVKILK